jgi:hypothetical protein
MYRDLQEYYWWNGMKKKVEEFVQQCLTCQRVKPEHQKPARTLKSLTIPEWKWDHIAMDFITNLPKATNGLDVVWVVVDRLTKSAHFLTIKTIYDVGRLDAWQKNMWMKLYDYMVYQ